MQSRQIDAQALCYHDVPYPRNVAKGVTHIMLSSTKGGDGFVFLLNVTTRQPMDIRYIYVILAKTLTNHIKKWNIHHMFRQTLPFNVTLQPPHNIT